MVPMLLTVLQILIGLLLIFIIMLQRGKGGGLVGALGGMGGASAFGPKADIHVLKLTIGLAIAWVVIACGGIYANRNYNRGKIGAVDVVPKKTEDDKTEDGKVEDGKTEGTSSENGDSATTKDGDATPDATGPDLKLDPKSDEKSELKAEADAKDAKPAADEPKAEKTESVEPEAEKTDTEKK